MYKVCAYACERGYRLLRETLRSILFIWNNEQRERKGGIYSLFMNMKWYTNREREGIRKGI